MKAHKYGTCEDGTATGRSSGYGAAQNRTDDYRQQDIDGRPLPQGLAVPCPHCPETVNEDENGTSALLEGRDVVLGAKDIDQQIHTSRTAIIGRSRTAIIGRSADLRSPTGCNCTL